MLMMLLAGALGRDMAQAPAGQSKPIADLLFILSADMVSFELLSSCDSWPGWFDVQRMKSKTCITSAPSALCTCAGHLHRRKHPGPCECQLHSPVLRQG